MLWGSSFLATWRDQAEIVHVQGADAPVANVVTAQCCNAVIRHVVDGGGGLTRKFNYWLGDVAEHYCFAKSSTRLVIAVSHKVKRDIEENYGVESARIVVVPHGADADIFHPRNAARFRGPVREQLGLGTDDFVILFVGGDYRLKGLVTLLEALEMSRLAIKVIALGVSPDPALEALVSQKGLQSQVRFMGPIPDPVPYFSAADCFVLPTRYDTFSMATMEAMATGLPVVVSSAAGVAEYLETGRDCLILEDPRDAKTLATYLARLTSDKALRDTMGKEARKTAEGFSWDKVAEQTFAAYQRIL
jgi:UDP-glucose:(heptosyl)LPS alpha-1,3-glucosyltransferase